MASHSSTCTRNRQAAGTSPPSLFPILVTRRSHSIPSSIALSRMHMPTIHGQVRPTRNQPPTIGAVIAHFAVYESEIMQPVDHLRELGVVLVVPHFAPEFPGEAHETFSNKEISREVIFRGGEIPVS
jgi:hypothetical protein